MIPFKFRAWDKDEKVMRSWIDIELQKNSGEEWYFIGYKASKAITKFDHVQVLMQYTGLKDKNGVEIYEGDIVRWKDLESFDDFPIDEVFKVEYSDEFMKWIICNKNDLQDDLYDFTDNRDLEVIGNIYENPELLEVEE